MKKLMFSLLLGACASSPTPDACPKCYAIDEVVPYEPPRRMIILCDQPDAARVDEPDAAPSVDDETGPIRF